MVFTSMNHYGLVQFITLPYLCPLTGNAVQTAFIV